MKLFYLPAIILLAVSCTNEIAENTDTGENILRIGEIDTRSGETSEWVWKTGDKLTVEVNGSTAEYTYTDAGKWTCGDLSFTKEKLGIVAPGSVGLSFGCTYSDGYGSQTTESGYRFADYMKGTGSLDGVTVSGELAHMNTDWVINITEGSGWGGKFESAMSEAVSLVIKRGFGTGLINKLQAYHKGATFRIILPPKYVPKGTDTFGTLTFGNGSGTPESVKGKSATITYTHNYDANELVGKRLTLTVKLDASLNLTITGITVKDFTGKDVSGELKP